jgi:hypothetical protein
MNPLMLIWWLTVVLAVLSLLAMTVLITYRLNRNRRLEMDDLRREVLKKMAWELMDRPDRLVELKSLIRPDDRRLLVQLFAELLQKIRGKYADRLVSLMRLLGLIEECLEGLNERSCATRAEACTVLGAFNEPQVRAALYAALEDPVMEVRVEAARSLVRLGAVRSVTRLIRHLTPVEGTPSLAVVDLFRNLGRQAIRDWLGLLDSDAPVPAKLIAIDALGHSGDLQAVPALLQYYDHPSQTVRVTTLQSLGLLRDPRAVPAVLLAMMDHDPDVRAQAAVTAGDIGSKDAIPVLERLLEDDSWWVRYRAAEALYRIGDAGIYALNDAAVRPHPVAAEIAWDVLREKGVAA